MRTLLSLDVSPCGDRSISRALGRRFVEHWQQNNPDGQVIYRDLNASRIPYMDNDWIAGVYAPPSVDRTPEMQKALALSEEHSQCEHPGRLPTVLLRAQAHLRRAASSDRPAACAHSRFAARPARRVPIARQ